MIMHEITLDGYAAQCAEQPIRLGTAASYGVETLSVMRKGEWVDYDIIVAFHPPNGESVQIRLESDNVVSVPAEATAAAGTGELTFAGYTDGVRQISVSQIYRVAVSAGAEGIAPAEPTPDVVQQILSAANEAANKAEQAQEAAQSVRDDADAGKFNGPQGPKGDAGPIGPQGPQWVCDEVDLERGVTVQRVNRLKLDGLSWRYELTPTNKSDTFISNVPASQDGTTRGYSLCQYAVFDGVAYDIEMAESCRCYVWVQSVTLQFKAGSGVNSVVAFSEWLEARPDASIFYCLATPIETPLTPAEIAAYKALTAYAPDTVVQASDGAGVKLDYQRDVNIVIKKLEDAIASMTTT